MKTKIAGTLKCEIIKPCGETWDDVGARLRALRDTLAPALNETMRIMYPAAHAWIAAMRDKNKSRAKMLAAWQGKVKKQLLAEWKLEMARRSEFDRKRMGERFNARAFEPPGDRFADRSIILSRYTGSPLKELMASRASVPSWRNGTTFYSEGRHCEVGGSPREARLMFPLWGSGSRATQLAVAPCGKFYETLWGKLVSGEYKLGRVGISYDQRKRKWYALISWTAEVEIANQTGQSAACNMGVNVFMQAVAEDGAAHRVDGADILVTRKRFAHRRWSIQKALDTMGTGSRGHGRKRRLMPLTKIEDAEGRWAQTKCRMVAAELLKWCGRHRVGRLILEDLSEVRDSVSADEPAAVRRMVHQWPFYELRLAIERQAQEHGVTVELKSAAYNSQRCPVCEHTDPENVKQVQGREEFHLHHGRAFSRREKRSMFECGKCGAKMDGDVVAASNLLAAEGGPVLKKVAKRSRKTAREKTGIAA